MRILAKSTLRVFSQKYPDAKLALDVWYRDFSQNRWESPHHIKQVYRTASVLGKQRVVFNIKGNKYRLIVSFHFDKQKGYIKFIGTHAEYDKVDALTVDLF